MYVLFGTHRRRGDMLTSSAPQNAADGRVGAAWQLMVDRGLSQRESHVGELTRAMVAQRDILAACPDGIMSRTLRPGLAQLSNPGQRRLFNRETMC
jgi:hypothetical protein